MRVEYNLTPEDLFAFQWRAAYTSPVARRTRKMSYLILFLTFVIIALLPAEGPQVLGFSKFDLLLLGIAFPITAVLGWLLERTMTRRTIRALVRREQPDKGLIGRHSMTLDESGILESTDVGDSRTAWQGIDRIEQDDNYIFIYTTQAAAHIIPKRAFDGSEAEDFYDHASAMRGPLQTG